jgi:hypothetical protein
MPDDVRTIVPVADHLFSLDTLHEAHRLATDAPERVTDVHLAHLAHYVSPRALTDIVQRRADAVQRRADEAFADAQAHAVDRRRTAAAPVAVPAIDALIHEAYRAVDVAALDGLTFDEKAAKYPDLPVTMGLLRHVVQFASDMNERNKERNAKIAALEARVLELEAQRVINDVKP